MVADGSIKDVKRCYRLITKQMDEKMEMVTPADYVRRFCSHLGLTQRDMKAAEEMAEAAVPRNPAAAGCAHLPLPEQSHCHFPYRFSQSLIVIAAIVAAEVGINQVHFYFRYATVPACVEHSVQLLQLGCNNVYHILSTCTAPLRCFPTIDGGASIYCIANKQASCGRAADARARLWDGKSPVSIAAGVIYTICLLPQASKAVSPADIAQAAGVAEGTVRNTYRDLYADVATLVPAWFLDTQRLDLRRLPQPHSAAAPI